MSEELLKKLSDQMHGKAVIPETTPEDLVPAEEDFEDAVEDIITEEKTEVRKEDKKTDKKEKAVAETASDEEESVEDILASLGISDDETPETTKPNGIPEGKPSEESSLNIESIIKEKTGGKFSSLDEMLNKINEAPKQNSLSPRIQKLIEMEEKGVDLLKVLEFDKINVENLNPAEHNQALSIIKSKLILDNPEMSEKLINTMLKEYVISDMDDESEVELKTIKAFKEAKKNKAELLEYKKQIELPKNVVDETAIAAQKEEAQQAQQKWVSDINNFFSKYDTETIDTGEGELKFQIKDEVKRSITESLSDMSKYWQRYTNPDGTTNMKKLIGDLVYSEQRDAMNKTIYQQGFNQGQQRIALRFKNAKARGGTLPANNEQSVESKLAKKFFNR